ncbi:SDR family oxidoreductase [Cytobacillus kochii]|uniref:elongation factor P 5-aminopentanone reductase n=1 Tax=Cytobacillus TaxID=2675230 RepID=UPI002E219C4F|nr:SDR family oxidoreductase [Cytobacillus kochii]
MKKFVLITGASGDIGEAIAQLLAKEGYSLYLHYNKNQSRIDQLMAALNTYGGEYIAISADLTSTEGYQKIVKNIFSLDAIIHCSGHAYYGLLTDMTDADVQHLMNVHVLNPILLTRALMPKLVTKQRGNIQFISSIWGQTGSACETVYSAVKGAQISFVKALSKEVAYSGIRVNAIAPGAIESKMMSSFNEMEMEDIKNDIPIGRFGHPSEVAHACAFLLSDASSYITGQTISVNGGWYT